jgi:hypothetical protein
VRLPWGDGPGHIHVVGGGKYENAMTELNGLMAATDTNPVFIAQTMQQIARGGRVPRVFAQNPEHAQKLVALSRLMLGVEPGRGLAATVTLPMNLNLLRDGHMSSEQAFVSLNQMSPKGAVRPAFESDVKLGFDRVGGYKTPASPEQQRAMETMLATEREALAHWLLPRSQGSAPLFSNKKELGELLRSGELPGFLVQDVKRFYGQED